MSEQEFNEIFSRRLKHYMAEYGINQSELAKRVGVSPSTINSWYYAQTTPRIDKVDKLCKIFNCTRDELITDHDEEYYYNKETAAIAQEIHDNPDLRGLFSAARDSSPSTLKALYDMLQILKRREYREDDD